MVYLEGSYSALDKNRFRAQAGTALLGTVSGGRSDRYKRREHDTKLIGSTRTSGILLSVSVIWWVLGRYWWIIGIMARRDPSASQGPMRDSVTYQARAHLWCDLGGCEKAGSINMAVYWSYIYWSCSHSSSGYGSLWSEWINGGSGSR